MTQLLTDWDAEAIRQTLIDKQADTVILRVWAETAQPNEQYRWSLQPEVNWLRDYSKKQRCGY